MAKNAKPFDGRLYNDMLKLQMRLYQLDLPDEQEEFNWFEKVVIYQEFRPEEFKHTLRPGYEERIEKKKLELMAEIGLVTDVEFEDVTDGTGD